MSIYEAPSYTNSSTSVLSSPQRSRGPRSIDRSHSEDNQSQEDATYDLPQLQRVRSNPMYEAHSRSECHSSARKPLFKIGLPQRNPLLIVNGPSQATSPGFDAAAAESLTRPVTIFQEPVLPQFLVPFHLTPPEELPVSPLDSVLTSTFLPTFIPPVDCFLSDTTSMISNVTHDEELPTEENAVIESEDVAGRLIDFNEVATFIVDRLAEGSIPATSMSVVHQPLPFPLPHRITSKPYADSTLFPLLLARLRHDHRLPSTAIRTSHVLSDKLPQENLPTSPPVTPSYLARNSQQGYFSIKPLFSSISPSSGLAVPPGEALLSMTERMIPPSTEFEISTFLGESTDSGFHERLSELAPGGLFITILPTRKGGETFHQTYLSKILDPILRNMVVRLGLRTEFARDVSNAVVLKQLSSFQEMHSKIQSLLATANNNNSLSFSSSSPPRTQFALISSQKNTINLPFEIWYSWWLGQERSRIMGLLNYHLNVQGQGFLTGVTRSGVMLELEEKMQAAGASLECEEGIELGVFIVQRTISPS